MVGKFNLFNLFKKKKNKTKKQKKAKSSGGGLLKNLFKKKKEKKAAKKQAKADKKTAKKASKTLKKATKAENKAVKQLAKQNKERKGANIIDKVTAAQDAAQMLAPELYENAQNKIKNKLNLNEDEEMSDVVTQEENSSGEFATASKKEDGFFAQHKALIIGAGLVAVAGIVTAIIFSKKKPTQAVAGLLGDIGETDDDDLGYIEPIDLS